jgi:hypothetical protein
MPVNKFYIVLLMLLVLAPRGCIDPFEPVIEESQEVLVINGMISDQAGLHAVEISRTSPYNEPSLWPLTGCVVSVVDESGSMIHYEEEYPGSYWADIPASFLEVGKAYSLHVITPDLQEYRSDFDSILPCPTVDSLYFEVENQETSNPDVSKGGIQFYLDMSGSDSEARNFMWKLEETWEVWAPKSGQFIWWGGEVTQYFTYFMTKCWKNFPIRDFYTGTTRNLLNNALQRKELKFISNETDRLRVTYSLLAKQQSLSRSAYEYWQKMELQSVETGGLYENQPSSAIGNLYNVDDPGETVLGIFYATQLRSKRVMVRNIQEEHFEFVTPYVTCELYILNMRNHSGDFPFYMRSLSPLGSGPPYETGEHICFDCRLQGGSIQKPDYW